jgi:cytochrome c oxidase subunit IV
MTQAILIRVWIFLLILTGVEVWLGYVHAPASVMLAALLGLSLVKAAYIIAYFMHMKYERRGLSVSLFPILVICILALLMLLPDAARAQCVMCKRTAEAQNAERAKRMNQGILVLALPPVFIIGPSCALNTW